MKKVISLFIVIVISLLFCSCEDKNAYPEYFDYSFTAMDTVINFRLARNSGEKDEKKHTIYFDNEYLSSIGEECASIIADIEKKLSRTDSESLISEINTETQHILSADEEVYKLISKSFDITNETEGAFDITIGTLSELWNITSPDPDIPDEENISEALLHVGKDKITLENGDITKNDVKVKLDMGAVGKGYALGKVIEHLKNTDVKYGIVSIGGNVGVFGEKPADGKDDAPVKYKVGITDPFDTSKVSGFLYIDKGFVSVSGDYERYFEVDGKRYHHIFDIKTGRPAESDVSSVAVWSDNADEADALSTALFVMGSDKAEEFYKSGKYGFEAILIKKDGTVITTSGIEENFLFEEYIPETTENNGGAN